MRLRGDRLSVLLEHGLGEHQAKAYLALLEHPSIPAGALARSAQVPRNRLYEVLEELQAMGLAEIILGETRHYRALPFTNFLDRTLGDLRERVERIESQRSYLAKAFQPPELGESADLDAGSTRAVLSRRAVARDADRIVASAQTSLTVSGSEGGWERVVQHLAPRVRDGLDGLDLHIILPRAAALAGGAEKMGEEPYGRVRWSGLPLGSLCFIADAKEMLLVHPIPDDHRLRAGRDFALLTTNPVLIRDQLALLKACAPMQ